MSASFFSLAQFRSDLSSSLYFEALEDRRVLTATLYVDPGFGFIPDGFTINDTQSASLGGPEVFDGDHHLTSLSQDLWDFHQGDSDFTNSDVQDFIDGIFVHLYRFFQPLDVDVEYAEASSLQDIADTLDAIGSNDAYIFIGGTEPSDVSRGWGAAVIDEGNSTDNLGFVFTGQRDFGDFDRMQSIVAANVARRAAFTFGAHPIEASVPAAYGNITSISGTDESGDVIQLIPTHKNYAFMRYDLPRTMVEGISPGSENPFEILVENVGLHPNVNYEYVTTTGQSDDIQIEFADGVVTNFTINGRMIDGIDLSKRLDFKVAGHYENALDTVTFSGESIDMFAYTNSISLRNKTVSFHNSTWQTDQVPMRISVHTGDFDDLVRVLGSTRIFTHGGSDELLYDYGSAFVDLGDGDDIASGSTLAAQTILGDARIIGGNGRDTFRTPLGLEHDVHIWDVNEDDGFVLGSRDDRFYNYPRWTQFEVIDKLDNRDPIHVREGYIICEDEDPENCYDEFIPITHDHIETFVTGDTSKMVSVQFGYELEIKDPTSIFGSSVFVQSTVREMNIAGVEIQVSSDRDWQNGNTDQIQYALNLHARDILISNRQGQGKTIEHLGHEDSLFGQIRGITPSPIRLDGPENATIWIHGSDHADYFTFLSGDFGYSQKYHDPFLNLFGHGGDDGFTFGSGVDENNGNLAQLFRHSRLTVIADGGEGSDFVYLNDAASEGNLAYQLTGSGIRDISQSNEFRKRPIPIINFQSTELIRLAGNSAKNHFVVEPSPNVLFHVEGQSPGAGDGDSLDLIDPSSNRSHIIRAGQGNGTWYFGNQPTDDGIVTFDGIEQIAETQRLAVASQAGQPSLVRVFDPANDQFLFDIEPFNARFLGGVQVETADLNGDSVPDIVVAPGPGRYATVRVFDGIDGALLKSFRAFPADSPNFFENYTGGVELAVANVRGDEGFEIIAATQFGTSDVRTFVNDGSLNFDLVHAYNPFPNQGGVGVRLATADFNQDGLQDIVSTLGPGGRPSIAVHSNGQTLHRFLGRQAGYLGGFNVAAGDLIGDSRPDLILAASHSGSADDLFSGQFWVVDGTHLPGIAPNLEVRPTQMVQAFEAKTSRSVSLRMLDANLDGIIDRIFAAQQITKDGSAGEIRSYLPQDNFQQADSLFADGDLFDTGIELG